MLTGLDILGHLGYTLIFLGMVSIAKEERVGWILRFLGEAIWVIIGIYLGMTSIWIWGSLFMFIDMFAIWRNYGEDTKG